MIDFCSYNVRGLNNKRSFIKDFIASNKISLIGLLETRVNKDVAKIISTDISPRFNWVFNYEHHSGGRIWVGWNPTFWDVNVVSSSSQLVTCSVSSRNSPAIFFISFVYGLNTTVQRRDLWDELSLVFYFCGWQFALGSVRRF